jgi:hypothetical protein
MTFRILLTTTSYQDTPGTHHELLKASGFEVVRARGPLKEQAVLDLIKQNGGFNGPLSETGLAAEPPRIRTPLFDDWLLEAFTDLPQRCHENPSPSTWGPWPLARWACLCLVRAAGPSNDI